MKYTILTLMLIMTLAPILSAGDKLDINSENNFFFTAEKPFLYAQSGDLNEDLYSLEEESAAEGRKSPTKAVLLSLVLPGLGELYAGRTTRAVGFFTAEAGIWGSYIYFKSRESWLEDDYINLAVEAAGIDPDGKNDFFYDMVGFYDNRDEYNKVSLVYNRSNPYFPETPEWDWQWTSDELKTQYRDIKNSANSQGRNANFSLGLALANRVISAIDAWWSVKSYNQRFSPLLSNMHLRLTPSFSDMITGHGSPGFMLTYKHSF